MSVMKNNPRNWLDEYINSVERDCIVRALERCEGNQAKAAKYLGITERSMWYRVARLKIKIDRKIRVRVA